MVTKTFCNLTHTELYFLILRKSDSGEEQAKELVRVRINSELIPMKNERGATGIDGERVFLAPNSLCKWRSDSYRLSIKIQMYFKLRVKLGLGAVPKGPVDL